MNKKNHYQLLGVPMNADTNAIKRAYRSQITKHHPDKNGSDAQMAQQLNIAYAVLKDPVQRARYDAYLVKQNQSLIITSTSAMLQRAVRMLGKNGEKIWHKLRSDWQAWRADTAKNSQVADRQAVCVLDLQTAFFGGAGELMINDQRFSVQLKAGIGQGERLHFVVKGEPIIATARIEQADVHIDHRDVHILVKLNKSQAKNGARITLPVPLSLTLRLPSGQVYPTQICVQGRGIPAASGAGDLFVRFEVLE